MREHLASIYHQQKNASIRLPNNVFKSLSTNIRNKSNNPNVQQASFAYSYLITIAFLYKYAHYVDIGNKTYIQNSDIKELLGYNKDTKTINKVIKKNGILDEIGLTRTTKDYPIRYDIDYSTTINKIPFRDYTMASQLDSDDIIYQTLKDIVKNRNYEVKEPLFLTTEFEGSEYGTFYNVEKTHQITLKEFQEFINDDGLNNIDLFIYGFFKSRCKGYHFNKKAIAVYKITSELGIDRSTFFDHLEILKKKNYIWVNHKEWKKKGEKYETMEANDYIWKGI